MPKLTESTELGEVILPVSSQSSYQSLQKEHPQKSYNKWIKAGFVFAATTGAFVLTKATGGLSWMSSWFAGEHESMNDNEVSELAVRVSSNGLELSNSKDFQSNNDNNIDVAVLEGLDTTEARFRDEIEDFEELELLNTEKVRDNVDSIRSYGGRKLLSFSSSVIELSGLNGANGFKINGEKAGDQSGSSVSGAGDINGDGFDDLIIGAVLADPNGDDSGRSYVIFGSDDAFPTELNLTSLDGKNGFKINGEEEGDQGVQSVSPLSGAGDINGDGFDDLIIGAMWADPNGLISAGRSYVIFGKNTSFPSELNLTSLNGTNGFKINGEAADDSSGVVSPAGDINGDGFDDLIIGAVLADPNGDYSGRSYVIFGKNTSFPSELNLTSLNGTNGFKINGEDTADFSGVVSAAGDINGDGFDDIIIGAAFAESNGNFMSGRSYVIFGKNTSFSSELELSSLNGTNGFKINGEKKSDQSGSSVSGAGDVNGDGFDDLIIGAYRADPNGDDSGRSYVIFGSDDAFPTELNLTSLDGTNGFKMNGETEGDDSGYSVSGAGDVNGDGFDDLIIGAQGGDKSYVIFGKNTTFPSELELSSLNGTNGFKMNGETGWYDSGYSVSGAGDVNGDGFDDLIVGAPDANPNGLSSAGRSYVIFGMKNFPPVLSSFTSVLYYTEGDGAIVVNGDIEISDADSLNLSNATVEITSGFISGEDVLEFKDQNGIAGSYSGSTGVLTLTGDSTITDYQTALRSVRYNNTEEDPSEVQRIVSFMVNDGETDSLPITRTVNVISINDIPIVSSSTSSLLYTEGDGAIVVNGDIEITDLDSANLSSATVSITSGFVSGEDVLEFKDQSGIAGSYSGSTGVLTLTGVASIADYQTALRSITYNNTEIAPSEVQRTVSFVVNDGDDDSIAFATNINVTAINSFPVLSSSTSSLLYTEGDGEIVVNGDIEISDLDGANLSNATVSITSGFILGEDILEFKDQNGIIGSYSSGTGKLTLTGDSAITDYQTALRSVRYNNTEEDPSEVQRTVSFMVSDGESNSLPLITTVNVTAVDDSPVLSSSTNSLSYTEGDGALVVNENIEISDVDSVNLSNATVSITSGFVSGEDILEFKDQSGITGSYSSGTGILTLLGNANIAEYQAALRSVRYNNTEEDPSEVQRTVSFMVSDGESNSLPLITTVNVTAVDDVLTRDSNITIPDRSIESGEEFSFTFDTNIFVDPDDDIGYTATLSNGDPLPTWLLFNPNNATFSGAAPSETIDVDIHVTASNGKESVTSNVFRLTVLDNSPQSSDDGDYLGEILGGIAGGIAALGLASFGIWKCMNLRKDAKKSEETKEHIEMVDVKDEEAEQPAI